MKVKTSVTLSEELLQAISAETSSENRSAFIEAAMWEYLEVRRKRVRDRREMELISANADLLNDEARDALEFQDDG
jgi:metal-responsive CopG/Arc/MetJ family transcriptional regulator